MSALLALIVFGGAVWFVMNVAGVRPGSFREPIDSISEFSRAMSALDPTPSAVGRQAVVVPRTLQAPRTGPPRMRAPGPARRPVQRR
ncbi:hypothetical protein BH23ACT9_BH23ACT9_11390 [soil metagenome]